MHLFIRFHFKTILIAAKNYSKSIGRIIITFRASVWNGTLVKDVPHKKLKWKIRLKSNGRV